MGQPPRPATALHGVHVNRVDVGALLRSTLMFTNNGS
jgi:hypothetical protein